MNELSDRTPSPKRVRRGLVLLTVLSALALAWTLGRYGAHRTTTTRNTRASITERTERAALRIDGVVRSVMVEVDAVARELSSGALPKDGVTLRFSKALAAHPEIQGISIAYRPFGRDPHRRLYRPLHQQEKGVQTVAQADEIYDYTLPQFEWYQAAMKGASTWGKPTYGAALGMRLMIYSVPFLEVGGDASRPLGVVALALSLDHIRTLIEALDLGPGGFGALVSPDGTYIYHPNPEFIVKPTTLLEVAKAQDDPDRAALADAAAQRRSGLLDHRSRTTGQESWLAYAPVPAPGWSLQNTFLKDEIPVDGTLVKHLLLQVLLGAMVFILCGGALLLRVEEGLEGRHWGLSNLTAVVFLLGIGCVWQISMRFPASMGEPALKVAERATLQTAMVQYLRTCEENHTEPPIFVPTGVFLESAQFTSATDLQVTGYLWQRYELGSQHDLARGFTLGDVTQLEATENYRVSANGFETVRWHFKANIRQRLEHARYPLEVEQVALRILHKELNHNVVLVPDLAAYRVLNPTALPGLAQGLKLSGWQITATCFDFRKLRFDTNFGVDRSYAKENLPSLHYTLMIRRNVLDAFLSNLTPLFIVAAILFILIMLSSRDERLVSFLQAGSGRILNICTAMFFVIAFSHIEVRRRIASEAIFYMEYFYFLIYFGILWVCVNSVLYATRRPIWIIQYRENLIAKLAYWPFLLGVLFLVTLRTFY
ncbi:MAG: cache domain-containing protein [Betaproteobacteria bacterium]